MTNDERQIIRASLFRVAAQKTRWIRLNVDDMDRMTKLQRIAEAKASKRTASDYAHELHAVADMADELGYHDDAETLYDWAYTADEVIEFGVQEALNWVGLDACDHDNRSHATGATHWECDDCGKQLQRYVDWGQAAADVEIDRQIEERVFAE